MATQGKSLKIGRYFVVLGAEPTPTGTFSPIFGVHEGDTLSGKIVYEQKFSADNPTFATENEAFDAAEDMAIKWIYP